MTRVMTNNRARTTALHVSWPDLEPAVEALKARLTSSDCPGFRTLIFPGMPQPLTVSLDLELARFCWRYSLGPPPTDNSDWPANLAAAQGSLSLSRVALTHGKLVLAAETPVPDNEALATTLQLLIADVAAGHALYSQYCAVEPVEALRMKVDPLPAVSSQVRAEAQQAVTIWMQEATAAGWQPVGQNGDWRLVRAPWAPDGLPPVCRLRLEPFTVAVSSTVLLPAQAAPVTRQALSLFLLHQNARHLARAMLEVEGAIPSAVKIELNLPLIGLEGVHVAEAVAAVSITYEALRWEVAALCDPALAQLYLHIAHRKLANGHEDPSTPKNQSEFSTELRAFSEKVGWFPGM